jgi:hypothetical protein
MVNRTKVLGPLLLLLLALGLVLALRAWGSADWLSALGNVVIGAVVALAATMYVEKQKRDQLVEDLAIALYHELASRVARCCYDFEKPWNDLWHSPQNKSIFDAKKFVPEPTTIYNGNADKLALLGPSVPAALMPFYFRLWGLRRDIDSLCDAAAKAPHLNYDQVQIIASRMAATLTPGLAALRALGDLVPDHDVIDAAAWKELDREPNKRKDQRPLRERLADWAQHADARLARW